MSIPYKRVLVPLDGSKIAERSLGHAVSVAETFGAELVLLHVVEPIADVAAEDAPHEESEPRRARSVAYLDGVRHRIAGRPLHVTVAVESGASAGAIIDYALAHRIDLIVMATHGRSGVRRWLLGGTASKVVQRAETPVLLVNARE